MIGVIAVDFDVVGDRGDTDDKDRDEAGDDNCVSDDGDVKESDGNDNDLIIVVFESLVVVAPLSIVADVGATGDTTTFRSNQSISRK